MGNCCEYILNCQFQTRKKKKKMMFEEKEEPMVPLKVDEGEVAIPKFRKAHFLKPLFNPRQPLPEKPLSSNGVVLKNRVSFRGKIGVQIGWEDWVKNLKPTHHQIWEKAGIFDAIMASTYNVRRHDELIIWLAQKWCPRTNTFIFPWGETTITLEDVLILGGFSVLGTCVRNPCLDPESERLEKKLVESCKEMNTNVPVTHDQWIDHYKGRGGELENVALIVLWLSRYIFSTNYYSVISPFVLPVAVNLARGVKIALGPSVLASIYRDMSLLKEQMVITNGGGFEISLWSPLQYLQLWAWERFPTLSPKPTPLAFGEPRLARWHDVVKPKPTSLGNFDMECDGNDFVWRPYTLELENWVFPTFYPDVEMCVLINSDVDEGFFSWARCITCCSLVGMDCVETYHPHRVGKQFGMDQDIPGLLSRSSSDSYDRQLDGLKLYFPNRLFQGDVTMGYYCWWRRVPCWWRNDPYKAWAVYNRRKGSNKETKCVKESEMPEDHEDSGRNDAENKCMNEENQPLDNVLITEENEDDNLEGNSKSQPSLKIISLKNSDTFVEDQKENQKELECVMEPRKKLEKDEDDEDRQKVLNEENNSLDNVVIIDDSEDDSNENERNPLDAIAFQLEARIKKAKLLVSRLLASRQGR